MWLLLEVLETVQGASARGEDAQDGRILLRGRFPTVPAGYRGPMAAPVHDPVGPQPDEPAVRPLPGGPPEPATPLVPDPNPEPLPPEPAPQPV